MGTTVDSLYISPSIRGTAWSESGGRPAEAAKAESSTTVAMGPLTGGGADAAAAAVAGTPPPSAAAEDAEGGVLDAGMLPIGAERVWLERSGLFCFFLSEAFSP